MSKLIVPASKPRNPFVAAARFRQAGPHKDDRDAERRDAKQALKREFANLDLSHSLRRDPPGL